MSGRSSEVLTFLLAGSAQNDRDELPEILDVVSGFFSGVGYANGDSAVRPERDQLEGAVQVKFALWRAARCGFDRNA